MAKVTTCLLCARHRATGFANLNSSESQFSLTAAGLQKKQQPSIPLHSSVDVPLMKPQIKSQIAHDPKKNHQAYRGGGERLLVGH